MTRIFLNNNRVPNPTKDITAVLEKNSDLWNRLDKEDFVAGLYLS